MTHYYERIQIECPLSIKKTADVFLAEDNRSSRDSEVKHFCPFRFWRSESNLFANKFTLNSNINRSLPQENDKNLSYLRR